MKNEKYYYRNQSVAGGVYGFAASHEAPWEKEQYSNVFALQVHVLEGINADVVVVLHGTVVSQELALSPSSTLSQAVDLDVSFSLHCRDIPKLGHAFEYEAKVPTLHVAGLPLKVPFLISKHKPNPWLGGHVHEHAPV